MFVFFVADVVSLCRDWEAFANCFMDKNRREYLQSTLPALADCISTVLTTSVYMKLAQFFDPMETFNDYAKSNLVLRRVIDDIAPPAGTPERHQIEADYDAMEPTIKLIRQRRNSFDAHKSLATTLAIVDYIKSGSTLPHPMPRIPLGQVADTLTRLVNITDLMTAHVEGKQVSWYDKRVIQEIKTIFDAAGVAPFSGVHIP
jgi:hypothetical protein